MTVAESDHSTISLLLNVLKFGAILVGTTSGIVGTVTKTRDETGAPTPWMRRILMLLVISAAIAIATQAVETYLDQVGHEAERRRREAADARTTEILQRATAAAQGIEYARRVQDETLGKTREALTSLSEVQRREDEMHHVLKRQEISLGHAVTGIHASADTLSGITSGQVVELENLYRLTHPLGERAVGEMVIWYAIRANDTVDDSWLQRVSARASDRPFAIGSDADTNRNTSSAPSLSI